MLQYELRVSQRHAVRAAGSRQGAGPFFNSLWRLLARVAPPRGRKQQELVLEKEVFLEELTDTIGRKEGRAD